MSSAGLLTAMRRVAPRSGGRGWLLLAGSLVAAVASVVGVSPARPADASVRAGSVVEVEVGGRLGVPGDASAVAVNVAVVNPSGAGHVTAFPCGGSVPKAATVNHGGSGAVSNSAIVKLGVGGKLCVFSLVDADVVVDVSGFFPAGAEFVGLTPKRFADTRDGSRVGAGSVVEVEVGGRLGVPGDASAVAVNVAVVNPSGAGHVTAFPCGGSVPKAATVNHGGSGAVSNSAIVKLGVGGKLCVFSLVDADVVVDVSGFFPAGAEFVGLTPKRFADTRGTGTPAPVASPTPTVPPGDFLETFTGNTGLQRFDTGVYHRDDFMVATTTWAGDHDESCGDPTTQRTIHRDRPDESFYVCRDHLMTSVGDTSGYSIAWFSPKETFHSGSTTQVSFDVNVTDLGKRQWWEVSIVPSGAPFLATVDFVSIAASIDTYDPQSIVVGNGPYGNDGNIVTEGIRRKPLGYQKICGDFAVDPEACASKMIRRTFTITDNQNGTITFDYLGGRYTYPGEFPDDFRVYFKDHNYTPDKDGVPVGHTWHWDNTSIR